MKKGNIMRDVISSSQFTENVIKEYKKGLGDMVLVAITPRTSIVFITIEQPKLIRNIRV